MFGGRKRMIILNNIRNLEINPIAYYPCFHYVFYGNNIFNIVISNDEYYNFKKRCLNDKFYKKYNDAIKSNLKIGNFRLYICPGIMYGWLRKYKLK